MAKKKEAPRKEPELRVREEALQVITTRKNLAENFQNPLWVNFQQYYKLYRSVIDPTQQAYQGRSNLFVPYVYSTVETVLPRLVSAKPRVVVTGRGLQDLDTAKNMEKLINYEWDQMNGKDMVKDWVKQALLYGTGVVKIVWAFDPINEIDRPEVYNVDLYDFFVDPNCTTFDFSDAEWVIHRVWKDWKDVKEDPLYDVPPQAVPVTREYNRNQLQRWGSVGLSPQPDGTQKMAEVWEYWGKYDLDEDGIPEEVIITVLNQNWIIRMEPNPYAHKRKPFVAFIDTQLPNEFWGIGEIEPIQSLQYELNDIRNQRMDSVNLAVNQMWLVNKNNDLNEEELIARAGGVVHTDDMNAIRPLTNPVPVNMGSNEEDRVKGDIQQASGVSDYTKGVEGGSISNSTATGISLIQEAANARFRLKIDNLEDSLKVLGEQLVALNQQFIQREKIIRVTDDPSIQWARISPSNIKGSFDVIVEAGATQPMNRLAKRQDVLLLMQTMQPFVQAGIIDPKWIAKKVLETFDVNDTKEAFAQVPEVNAQQPVVQQNIPPEMMAGMASGGQVPTTQPQMTPANPIIPALG